MMSANAIFDERREEKMGPVFPVDVRLAAAYVDEGDLCRASPIAKARDEAGRER